MATNLNKSTNGRYDEEGESMECPLCLESLDMDDVNFFPCVCGYQICRFCWHRIRTDENGLCPQCRKPYEENPAAFKPVSEEELMKSKGRKRGKKGATETASATAAGNAKASAAVAASGNGADRERAKNRPAVESRKAFADLRVVQKNLVFVVGLSNRLANADVLKRNDLFGQFGKIVKVVISHNTAYAGSQPSASAYITYHRAEDAMRAIWEVNSKTASVALPSDAHKMRCSLGTTKYCSQFLKGSVCSKPDCMYLHEVGDPLASFTKENMQQGLHTRYEHELLETFKRSLTLKTAPLQTSSAPSGHTSTATSSYIPTADSSANSDPGTNLTGIAPSTVVASADKEVSQTAATRSSSSVNSNHSTASTNGGHERSRVKSGKTNPSSAESVTPVTATSTAPQNVNASGNGHKRVRSGLKTAKSAQQEDSELALPSNSPLEIAADEPVSQTDDSVAPVSSSSPSPFSSTATVPGSVDVHAFTQNGGLLSDANDCNTVAVHDNEAKVLAGVYSFPFGATREFEWPKSAADAAPPLQSIPAAHMNGSSAGVSGSGIPTVGTSSVIMQQLLSGSNAPPPKTFSPFSRLAASRDNDLPPSLAPVTAVNANPNSGMSLLQAIINSSRSNSSDQSKRAAQQTPANNSWYPNYPAPQTSRLPGANGNADSLAAFKSLQNGLLPCDSLPPSANTNVWSAADLELRLTAASSNRNANVPPARFTEGDSLSCMASDSMPMRAAAWNSHVAPACGGSELPPSAFGYVNTFSSDTQMPIGSRLLNTGLFEAAAPESVGQSNSRFGNYNAFSNGWS